jgi:hypothetical protein
VHEFSGIIHAGLLLRGASDCGPDPNPGSPTMTRCEIKPRYARLLALAAACVAAACGGSPSESPDPLPNVVNACETHTGKVCSTWTKTATGGYYARFDQGTEADLTVVRFDADSIVLLRTDRPGPAPYTTATYRAAPTGRTVTNGTVTWRQSGSTFSGPWTAEW